MGILFTEGMGNILTTLMGNVLTEIVGKVLDIYTFSRLVLLLHKLYDLFEDPPLGSDSDVSSSNSPHLDPDTAVSSDKKQREGFSSASACLWL